MQACQNDINLIRGAIATIFILKPTSQKIILIFFSAKRNKFKQKQIYIKQKERCLS